jgi:hypothetical protein
MNERSLSTPLSHFNQRIFLDQLCSFLVRGRSDPLQSWYGVDVILAYKVQKSTLSDFDQSKLPYNLLKGVYWFFPDLVMKAFENKIQNQPSLQFASTDGMSLVLTLPPKWSGNTLNQYASKEPDPLGLSE